jgi:hypothetical protein
MVNNCSTVSDIECLLGKPDDLWLTYAVVSLELNQLLSKDMLYLYIIYQQHRSQTGKQREQTNTGIQSQQQHRSRTGKRRKKPNTEIQSQQQFPTMEGL